MRSPARTCATANRLPKALSKAMFPLYPILPVATAYFSDPVPVAGNMRVDWCALYVWRTATISSFSIQTMESQRAARQYTMFARQSWHCSPSSTLLSSFIIIFIVVNLTTYSWSPFDAGSVVFFPTGQCICFGTGGARVVYFLSRLRSLLMPRSSSGCAPSWKARGQSTLYISHIAMATHRAVSLSRRDRIPRKNLQ